MVTDWTTFHPSWLEFLVATAIDTWNIYNSYRTGQVIPRSNGELAYQFYSDMAAIRTETQGEGHSADRPE